MIHFENMKELINSADQERVPIWQIILQYEAATAQQEETAVFEAMRQNWLVMQEAVRRGVVNEEKSASKLVGGDARRLQLYAGNRNSQPYAGEVILKTAAYALGVSEVNAVMGKIVACPTAGSCGILPAAVSAAAESRQVSETEIVQALFTAAGVGMVIAENASIAGAEGGCQAECGSAAGMAAAALVQLAGGTPQQVGNAVALVLKNMLGLVCDPVAGLVEVPCVKRNGFAAIQAVLAADMAMAGIESIIPVDEVIDAMYKIGIALPKSLRETSEGGLADTPTARQIEKVLYKGN